MTPAALLSSGCPSPRSYNHSSTAPTSAMVSAPLLGFRPLQRATISGARMTRRIPLPRHHPPSGFLTPSTACFARNPAELVSSPLRSWGSTESGSSLAPFGAGRADAPGSPLQGSPSPRDRHLVGGAPLSRFVGSGGGDAHASPSAEDRMRGLTPVTEPTGTTESSITKGSAFPTVANRKRRPS